MISCSTRPTYTSATILCLAALVVRALFFYCFMLQITSDHIHYHQADSNDYHVGALCIALGNGMSTPGNNQPMFWRTPGYPAFLALFYHWYGITSGDFNQNHPAQKAALWAQLILCCLIPLIILFLAHLLTGSWIVAWASAWISVFHIGFVLASTYLLTEGISMIFFYLFLIFFFKLLLDSSTSWFSTALSAMACLSIYTWIRPMGEFVGILTTVILLFGSVGNWRTSIKKSLTFAAPFFASLCAWYWRNYTLTGEWFYCPLSGIYLNVFCAPKILRRTMNISLHDAWKYTQQAAHEEIKKAYYALQGTGLYVSPLLSKKIAVPIIAAYPLYFIIDWLKESCKTAFDLYSYQLIAYAKCQFWFDPLEEFVTEKIGECLFLQPAPLWMRMIAWSELIYSLLIWIGLGAGIWTYAIQPFFLHTPLTDWQQRNRRIWIVAALLSASIIGMTGGFGYARLRLPVEPLMLILSIMGWAILINLQEKTSLLPRKK